MFLECLLVCLPACFAPSRSSDQCRRVPRGVAARPKRQFVLRPVSARIATIIIRSISITILIIISIISIILTLVVFSAIWTWRQWRECIIRTAIAAAATATAAQGEMATKGHRRRRGHGARIQRHVAVREKQKSENFRNFILLGFRMNMGLRFFIYIFFLSLHTPSTDFLN